MSFIEDLYTGQYSRRHSVINHCDRHITRLSNTDSDISFGLFNTFTYSDMPFLVIVTL